MLKTRYSKVIFSVVLLSGFILSLQLSFSVTAPISLGAEDQSTTSNKQAVDQVRAQLQAQLDATMKEIDQYQQQINDAHQQGNTLKSEITILENKIKKLRSQIKAINLTLQDLNLRIDDTKKAISTTEGQIEHSKELLINALQTYQDQSSASMLEIFLANDKLSDFFLEVNAINNLALSIQEESNRLKQLKESLDGQKADLQDQQDQNLRLKALQELQQKDLSGTATQKNTILAETKGKEANYQTLLKKSQATAAELRRQLFQLAGGSGPVTLEEAARIATLAGQAAGVRPAFLLAILDYESKLGKNVGKCSWRDSMSPTRDQPAFIKITTELSVDPDAMLVACPAWYGKYAGAMGPAQFLPSTWLTLEDQIANLTGHKPPSPWSIFDAFFAAAIKLAGDGANAKTYSAEWKAAMIYFAGGNWSNPRYRFYGDNVMDIAADYDQKLQIMQTGQ